MPQATTTLSIIRGRCQQRVGDVTTNIWSTTADGGNWSNAINDSILEILDDIILEKAWNLCDELHDYCNVPLVADQENYDYLSVITGKADVYYAFVRATWDYYPVKVISWGQYQKCINEEITATIERPFMTFWGDGYFKLRPLPSESDATAFTFYYIEAPITLDADSETPDFHETCVKLLYPKVAAKYWRRRRRFELAQMEEAEYERLKKKIIYPHRQMRTADVITPTRDEG